MTEPAAHADRTTSLILLDLYGALLTERMREVLDLYLSEDLSLGEIAENLSISRQGVHDTVTRGLASLQDMESRLQLLDRRQQAKTTLGLAAEAIRQGDTALAQARLQALADLL